MPRIELEQLIQGASQTTPQQINLLRWFYSQFDNRSAANRRITNVEPLYFCGAVAGTEFLTYAATKLYIALDFVGGSGAYSAGQNTITFYNEANAAMIGLYNNAMLWNGTTTVVNYQGNDVSIKTIYFSRVAFGGYAAMLFNGYRITLI